MNIPSKIRIKSRVSYEVLFSDLIKDDEKCLGYSDPKTRQIILRNGQSDSDLIRALIHEVIHAIEFEYEQPIPHKITYALEEGIFKVLKLNKLI